MSKIDKLKSLVSDINKKTGKNTMAFGSECVEYKLYPTPFPTVTNLIGGFPIGKFTTIAG